MPDELELYEFLFYGCKKDWSHLMLALDSFWKSCLPTSFEI